ncbi:MAG: ribosome maturation protein Sdo1, partial [Patescibacteria group bacterium]
MAETTARTKKEGKHYEILVDEEEAFKYKRGEGNINSAVLTDAIFHNLKSGEHASTADLEKNFGTSDPTEVAEKIIKNGEIVRTTES